MHKSGSLKVYVGNKEASEGKYTASDQAEALGGGPVGWEQGGTSQGVWASTGGLQVGVSPFDLQ